MSTAQKRKPFNEAPRDIANRSASNPIKNTMLSNIQQSRPGPPLSIRAKSAKTSDLEPDAKTRQYKAQSYSDKITIASQTQRIEALQAELEEVRLFASTEQTSTEAPRPANNDGELIEALAQELEDTEADLKAAQSLVGKLELELSAERSKQSSAKSVGTASTAASTASADQVAELRKVIERQNKEIEKCHKDAEEGVEIMRDLDKALRMARKERDVSRAGREEALSAMEECKKEMGGMQIQLKEREKQCTLLERSCDKMKEEQEALTVRYVALEGSLNELQNVLAMVQSRSEKKAASMKEAMAEVEEREEKSVIEYQTLMKKYNEVQRQCGEMEGVLTDMTTRFEEVKADCVRKEEELEMVEAKLATFIEETRAQHESEMSKLQSAAREEARVLYEAMLTKNDSDYESAMKEIRMLHDRQLKEKDELLKAREKQWEAKTRDFNDQEIQALKVKMQQIERENEQLKTEKAELTRKLEKGVAIYNETTSQLKAKTAEAVAASSNKGCDAELIAANKALKKDLTSAVESSISRGRQIQALEKEIESYQLKLTKANQHMKRMEKALPGLTSDNEETRRLESEICNLRSRAEEAERDRHILQERVAALDIQAKHANQEKQQLASRLDNLRANAQETEQTISNMMEEITALSTKASQVQTLERNLTDARLALANSQSRILDLEEALQETEIALRTVSSARLRGNSPTSSPGKKSVMECQESEMRRQIENMALQDYVGQRL